MSRFRSTNNFLLRCARPDSNAYDVISFLLKILTYRMETSFYCFVAKICSSRKISSRYRLSGDDLNVWSNAICLWERIEKQQINRRGKKNLFLHLWNTRITIECLNLSVSMISIIGFKCEEGKFRNLRKKNPMICSVKSQRKYTWFREFRWKKIERKTHESQSMEFPMNWIWNLSSFPFFRSLHHQPVCIAFPFTFLFALIFHTIFFTFRNMKRNYYICYLVFAHFCSPY